LSLWSFVILDYPFFIHFFKLSLFIPQNSGKNSREICEISSQSQAGDGQLYLVDKMLDVLSWLRRQNVNKVVTVWENLMIRDRSPSWEKNQKKEKERLEKETNSQQCVQETTSNNYRQKETRFLLRTQASLSRNWHSFQCNNTVCLKGSWHGRRRRWKKVGRRSEKNDGRREKAKTWWQPKNISVTYYNNRCKSHFSPIFKHVQKSHSQKVICTQIPGKKSV